MASFSIHRVLLLLYCSIQYATSLRKNEHGKQSKQCYDLWAGGENINVGLICMEPTVKNRIDETRINSQQALQISYQIKDGWKLHESFLWMGSDLSDLPQLSSTGQPLLDEFPFINQHNSAGQTYNVTIPFPQETACANEQRQSKYFVAVHPVLTRKANNTASKDLAGGDTTAENISQILTLRRQGDQRKEVNNSLQKVGLWWMEFEVDFSCTPSSNEPKSAIPVQLEHVAYRRHLHEFKRRNPAEGNCPSTSSSVSDHSELLTEDFLFKFHVASLMSTGVSFDLDLIDKIDYYRTIYERFNAFDDGLNDAALVAKVDGTCFAVFRGTVEYNYADVAQNFVFGFRQVPGTHCYVRRGYYDAYFTNYQAEFEQEIRECVDSCATIENSNEKCELIVSGASQGAATAVVASIQLFEEYDPILFSFGVPRAFLPTSPFDDHVKCTHVNEDKHYHFVLTDTFLKVFDPTPYYYAFWTKNVGREILFDGEGNFNDQGVDPGYIRTREPASLVIHTRFNYYKQSNRAYENACLPAPLRGWFDEHWCAEDDDCQATSYCQEGYCAPQYQVGEHCDRNGACLSGFCQDDKTCSTVNLVPSASEVGESCRSDSDCLSQRCDGWPGFSKCYKREATGGSCNEHSDCISGHCAGLFNGKCT